MLLKSGLAVGVQCRCAPNYAMLIQDLTASAGLAAAPLPAQPSCESQALGFAYGGANLAIWVLVSGPPFELCLWGLTLPFGFCLWRG